jgi:hypothetical protein
MFNSDGSRELLGMLAYLVGVSAILGVVAFGVHSVFIAPVSAERQTGQTAAETTGSKVDQGKVTRGSLPPAVSPASAPEHSAQATVSKSVSKGPSYGAIAKKKAQAELAAGKHKLHATQHAGSGEPKHRRRAINHPEARRSFGYAPEMARPASGPSNYGAPD